MRNEGPFIVEWVAWYRMLGFERVLVVTNDCTDRSIPLLAALQAQGWVEHVDCAVPPGEKITAAKLRLARNHPAVVAAELVFVCDVDEFLVIHAGEGRLRDLLARHPDFLGMAINWRVFGSDGRQAFEDRPVHRQFFGALSADRPFSAFVKTLYRHPTWFRAMGEHGPRRMDPGRAAGALPPWITAAGAPVPQWRPEGKYLRKLDPAQVSHTVAQVNHYMIRSEETFSLKAGTLSPAGQKDRYGPSYRERANLADEEDRAALRYAAAFDALFARAMSLPGVRRLHQLCCADHLEAIARKAGRDPALDPRIERYRALADAGS